MKLVFEQRLQDEMVRRQLNLDPELFESWTKRVEPVYQLPEEDRIRGFDSAFREFFAERRLGHALEELLKEFPFTNDLSEVLVFRAAGPREEGVELSRDARCLGIRLQPQRFGEKGKCNSFLRHELKHLADMQEPAFGYRNEPLTGEAAVDHGVLQRYRLLWDIYIDGRLARDGKEAGATQEERQKEFDRVFVFLARRERLAAFHGLWSATNLTHAELLAIAREPARIASLAKSEVIPPDGLLPGSLCPLCHFPSYDWAQPEEKLIPRIQSEFPGWSPEEGLCQRCYEHCYLKESALWR